MCESDQIGRINPNDDRLRLPEPAYLPLHFGGSSGAFLKKRGAKPRALAVVTAYADGIAGLRDLLRRLFRWRVGIRWYLVVFLGMPALLVGSGVLSAWLSGQPFKFEQGHKPLALYPVLISLVLDPGPLGEELGWRGFALPRLLHNRSAATGSVIVGLIWGL